MLRRLSIRDVVLIEALDLDSSGLVPWWGPDHEHVTLHQILVHVSVETARHAGHADIIRESIDGATMYALMATAEGWPATDWLQPWTPAE